MNLHVDPSSKVPVSEQVRRQIAARIERGRLGAGERLPPIRELAATLRLAPNTVAKAYRELESAGLLEGRGRHGTFVAVRFPALRSGADDRLRGAARAYAARARQLGVGAERALQEVRRALRRR